MKKLILPVALIIVGLLSLGAYFFNFGKDNLGVEITSANYIMPCAYKVYSNPQAMGTGEYYFFKMLLTNKGSNTMKDVKVSYRIPNFIDWTDCQEVTPNVYPGQHVVVICYPHFKDDIVNKMTQSQETGEIKIEYDNGKVKKESFGFNMMGRNQFVYTDIKPEELSSYADLMHNTRLWPCLITPEDPIVKYYYAKVTEKLMGGNAASVSNTPEDAVKFLKYLYYATYLSHMVYSGTEGIPQSLGDVNSLVQSIRLPREVITGNTGLCIEFSLMYASVLKLAGLHPVIFSVPSHAYPGVLVDGQYFAIEATGVNGEGLGGRYDPDAAFKRAQDNLKVFFQAQQEGDPRYTIIDVNDLEAAGVIPMELADDEFMKKKIDELSANFSPPNINPAPKPKPNPGPRRGGGGVATIAYSGAISFTYPASWVRRDYPLPQLSTLMSQIVASDQTGIGVWNVPASSPDQALYMIRQQMASMSQYIQYQKTNQANGYTMYQGVTNYNGMQRKWEGVFRSGGNGIVGITLGSPNFSARTGLFNEIISTLR